MISANQSQLAIGNPYQVVVADAAGAPSRMIRERVSALGFNPVSGTLAKPSGPGLPEALFDVGSSFKVRTALIAMHLGRDARDRFFDQIDGLLDSEEWDPQDELPTLESLDTFIRLQFCLNMARRPALGSTFQGNLVAAWLMEQGSITIECLPNDVLKWTLFVKGEKVKETAAGTTTIDRIGEILKPYSVETWSRAAPDIHGK